MENFSDRGIKKSVDWALVVTYLLLILIGWVNIYASWDKKSVTHGQHRVHICGIF